LLKPRTLRTRLGWAGLALLLWGSGPVGAATLDDYVLGPGDTIAISVFEHPEFSLGETTIRPDGLITHPFLGPLQVAGQTPTQLAEMINKELSRELRAPLVRVVVVRMAGVVVRGEVQAPGEFPAYPPLTVAKALTLALGFTPRANRAVAFVITAEGDQRRIDLVEALGERQSEFVLKPRETLLIMPADYTVTIIGEVGKPGKYELTPPHNQLLDALLACGWVTASADRKQALLVRNGDEVHPLDIAPLLNYAPGVVGPRLQGGDMLVFPRANNLVTVWGAVAKPGKYPLMPETDRVSDALAMSGGLTAEANPETATLIRASGETVPVDLKTVLEAPQSAANLQLSGGDTLLVATQRNLTMVLGAVAKPGSYPARPHDRLLDLLTQAGGVTAEADLDQVRVVRAGETAATVSIRSLLKEGDLANNLEVQVGDTIVVPPAQREVYVFGYVGAPGKYTFQEGDRVLDIMARCGGFDKTSAAPWGAALVRPKGVDADVYVLDLVQLMQGRNLEKNYPVENGDFLYVPKRTGKDWRQWVAEALGIVGLIRIFNW